MTRRGRVRISSPIERSVIHPILFRLGPLTFGSYGACVLLGAGAGWLLMPRYARLARLDARVGRELFFAVFVSGWFGCRLLNVLLRLPEAIARPDPVYWFVHQAGVWYGAIAGGLIAAIVLCRRSGADLWVVLDMAAVPAAIGGAIGRLGCLLSGCCYGKPTDRPWGIVYRDPVAHAIHPDLPYVPLHPAPLYEAVAVLLIAVALDRFAARPRRPGSVGLLWIMLYAVGRSAVEPFRGDAIRGEILGLLTTSQAIGLASAVLAAVLLTLRARRARPAGGRGGPSESRPVRLRRDRFSLTREASQALWPGSSGL